MYNILEDTTVGSVISKPLNAIRRLVFLCVLRLPQFDEGRGWDIFCPLFLSDLVNLTASELGLFLESHSEIKFKTKVTYSSSFERTDLSSYCR